MAIPPLAASGTSGLFMHSDARDRTRKAGGKGADSYDGRWPQVPSPARFIMFAVPLLLSLAAGQPANPVILLWEGKAPHAVGDSAADKPSLTVFKAPAERANGAAVVICPGGGYGALADDHEGKQVAEFLNGLGVTAFVLKYRIVTKDRPGPLLTAPLEDAQRA